MRWDDGAEAAGDDPRFGAARTRESLGRRGPKSELDMLELLTRTVVDLDVLRERAEQYGLSPELSRVPGRVGVAR